jgi:hypothetical protein
MAIGTSTGHTLLYDIRSANPLLVKDQGNDMPIISGTSLSLSSLSSFPLCACGCVRSSVYASFYSVAALGTISAFYLRLRTCQFSRFLCLSLSL